MANPVVHFEIMGKSAKGLAEFYRGAFDWNLNGPMGPQEYSLVEAAKPGIGGGIGSCPESHAGHVTFYVGVADLEAALKKIENLGGATLLEPVQVPGGPRIAMFSDPESHVVGLVQV